MKKNKLFAFVTAFSLVAAMSVTTVLAAEDVTEGIQLKTVSAEDTTRTIELYYVGTELPDVGIYEWNLEFPSGAVTAATYQNAIKVASPTFDTSRISEGVIGFASAMDDSATNTVDGSLLLGTLTLTVDSDDDFEAAFSYYDIFDKTENCESFWVPAEHEWAEFVNAQPSSITIAGNKKEDTRPEFTSVEATAVANGDKKYFDEDTTSVPVAAWKATVDYTSVKASNGLAWVVTKTDGSASDPIGGPAAATTVSGSGSVVYGFVVAGQAEQLDTIDTVTLVAATVAAE